MNYKYHPNSKTLVINTNAAHLVVKLTNNAAIPATALALTKRMSHVYSWGNVDGLIIQASRTRPLDLLPWSTLEVNN